MWRKGIDLSGEEQEACTKELRSQEDLPGPPEEVMKNWYWENIEGSWVGGEELNRILLVINGSHGMVVFGKGKDVEAELQDKRYDVDECLDLADNSLPTKTGIYVWEGVVAWEDDDPHPDGIWREPTVEELTKAAKNINPWNGDDQTLAKAV